jgi:hypothetical protein
MRNFWVASLVLAVVVCAGADDPKAGAGAKPATVPFELLKSGHMAVQVKLNGKGPYKLIFDTGAPTMLINNRIAKDSEVINKNTPKPFFAPFGSMGEFKIKEFELGELKATSIPAIVMDHPTVDAISRVLGPIDGLVGYPFFARYRMTIDYQAKEMTFVENGYKPDNVMQSMTKAVMELQNPNKVKFQAPAGLWGFHASKDSDDEEAGLDVRQVLAGGPAAIAGLQVGDRLLTVDGRWTDSPADLLTATAPLKPGKAVPVVVKRKQQEIKLSITPAHGL